MPNPVRLRPVRRPDALHRTQRDADRLGHRPAGQWVAWCGGVVQVSATTMSLRNPRYERFAYGLAEGKPAYQAYIDAGFAKAGAAQSASRLLKSQRAGIRERVAEILQEREQIDAEGTKLAIERTAIDKE
jgi:acyl-CoA reductase-like NAD-dependent aldehyde dehydrogenase